MRLIKEDLRKKKPGQCLLGHKYQLAIYTEKGDFVKMISRVVARENYYTEETYCRYNNKEYTIYLTEHGGWIIFV